MITKLSNLAGWLHCALCQHVMAMGGMHYGQNGKINVQHTRSVSFSLKVCTGMHTDSQLC